MIPWHALDKKEVLKDLESGERGLLDHEADRRLKKYGKNEIKEAEGISPFSIFFQQFKSIFILILLFAAVFSLFTQRYVDAFVIFAIVILNSAMGFFQQYKAEKVIAEMKEILVPNVKVFRNGALSEIPSSELVPGDILFISEGDKVMADCRILHSNGLQANEAVLTGESFPQSKGSDKISIDSDLANRSNMLYMGATIVRGSATAAVVETSMNTEFGKIAGLVQKRKAEKTPLEKKMDDFSKKIAVIIASLVLITISIGFLREESFYSMLLTGTALAISIIPEGVPAVIAITLALAIKRMHKHNALIRKLSAAETLGRTTVICVDKTGTLTEEEMTVTEVYCNGLNYRIDGKHVLLGKKEISLSKHDELALLLKAGILCNNARIEDGGMKVYGDPTEKALVMSAYNLEIIKKEETERRQRVMEYSFSSKRKLMSIVRKEDEHLVSYVKGAPDVLLKRCDRELIGGKIIKLAPGRRRELLSEYEEMASEALRVLGFAFKPVSKDFSQDDAENGLIFLGFQGMMDPPRKEVRQAIQSCLDAGIKVKMLTGDSALTARAVAKMIGLSGPSMEGKEMENISQDDFDKCVREKVVFARINPELKLRIVQSLKRQREIIAVTGDGVNDAPALKEAHIAIAMGMRGTDVAREVSDIILLDDNFTSIVNAVREGRRVYDNLRKSIKFHLAANVDELLVIFLALAMAFPLPLMPLMMLWMNLITDSLPSLSLSVENEEEGIMKRKPRSPEDSILKGILGFILSAGAIFFAVTMLVFLLYYQQDLAKARTMALTAAVFCELFFVFTCRSEGRNIWEIGAFSNKMLVYAVAIAFLLQLVAIYTPLSSVLGMTALSFYELSLCAILASSSLIFFEAQKYLRNRRLEAVKVGAKARK